MNIVVAGMMGSGTLEAKIEPLARADIIDTIFFLRKSPGKRIEKTKYITPPLLKHFNFLHLLITPFTLLYTTIRVNPKVIIGYHIIPYGFFAAFVGLITNTPYIIAQTGLTIQRLSSNWVLSKLLFFIFKHSLQVNCPGSASVLFWQKQYPSLASKFIVLHSTIDTDYWIPDPVVTPRYDFVFLGRLDPVKRIEMIIGGFRLFLKDSFSNHSSKFLIVGSGPEEERLKKIVAAMGIEDQVEFSGFVHQPLHYLQQSRFLVMSSHTEGLPTAMMQAMACGVVPITNLVGNISDLVEDSKTGFVHAGHKPEDISMAMKHALAIKDQELSMIKQAARKMIVNHHSHEMATKKWANLLSKASL